jgi:sec-independent protein translocase protein TatA
MNLGTFEITIIVVVILLFFGGKKIPELAKGIVKSIKEFNSVKKDIKDSVDID